MRLWILFEPVWAGFFWQHSSKGVGWRVTPHWCYQAGVEVQPPPEGRFSLLVQSKAFQLPRGPPLLSPCLEGVGVPHHCPPHGLHRHRSSGGRAECITVQQGWKSWLPNCPSLTPQSSLWAGLATAVQPGEGGGQLPTFADLGGVVPQCFLWCWAAGEQLLSEHIVSPGCPFSGPLAWERKLLLGLLSMPIVHFQIAGFSTAMEEAKEACHGGIPWILRSPAVSSLHFLCFIYNVQGSYLYLAGRIGRSMSLLHLPRSRNHLNLINTTKQPSKNVAVSSWAKTWCLSSLL